MAEVWALPTCAEFSLADTMRPMFRLIQLRFSFLPLLTALLGFFASGCAEKTPSSTPEGDKQAAVLLETLFIEREGFWLGLDQSGDKWRLVELSKPTSQVLARKISASERADGVSERHTLTIHCNQFRFWDEQWTEWQRAPGGGPSKMFLTAISPKGMGFRNYTLEKKAGRWSVRGTATRLESDRAELTRLIAAAYGSE